MAAGLDVELLVERRQGLGVPPREGEAAEREQALPVDDVAEDLLHAPLPLGVPGPRPLVVERVEQVDGPVQISDSSVPKSSPSGTRATYPA